VKFTKKCLLQWANTFDYCQFFRTQNKVGQLKELFAVGHKNTIDQLNDIDQLSSKYLFGYLGYDLKNNFEDLKSENEDLFELPDLFFFEPEYVFELSENGFIMIKGNAEVLKQIKNYKTINSSIEFKVNKFVLPFDKSDYLEKINLIKQQIQLGNLYETNFCIPFFSNECVFDPVAVFLDIDELAKAPFTSYLKLKDKCVLSFSPERYLKKEHLTLTTQPIKGTRKRGASKQEDIALVNELISDEKERSENIMIVDLVRNDLSKIAEVNSVRVPELCKVYSFEGVHQMISRVECEVTTDCTFEETIKATFPMGSMTGAPKISAMNISEQMEVFKRGIYSGSIGYIEPGGNFDFNVVIRSVLYDAKNKKALIPVGGAITIGSDANSEFEECLVKTKLLRDYFNK